MPPHPIDQRRACLSSFGFGSARELVRRAYEIWEREGQTHGLHERHWNQATFEPNAFVFVV
ncbi:MAG: DUF2934 domain-containing protein [Mesorhizobium sp.]|nr:MAG: DUF2934 domain-containing protein [Mesorhizobium sp.]